MPDDPVKSTVKGTIEALYKPVESIVKTLAGPAAEEVGLSFRDSVQAWRLKRQIRLFEKVKKTCYEAGINPQAVKLPLLFDVLQNATLQEDDELQDRWANLLSNAADPSYAGLISTAFPDILRQLSKDEALFLENLYKRQDRPVQYWTQIAEIMLTTPPVRVADVYEDNLRRLGLTLEIDPDETGPAVAYSATPPGFPEPRKWRLTAFGIAFVEACSTPKKSAK